jgi:predicted nucleotidyltransferase
MNLDEAKLAEYRAGARRRHAARAAALAARRARALALAREAARLLRDDFHVERVSVFGSAARGRYFDERSDLDLAVWGLEPHLHFRAQGRVLGLDRDFAIDLVRVEDAGPALREAIDRDGIDV